MYYTHYNWSTLYGFEWCVSLLQVATQYLKSKIDSNPPSIPCDMNVLAKACCMMVLLQHLFWWFFDDLWCTNLQVILLTKTSQLVCQIDSAHLTQPSSTKNRAPKATAWMAGIRAPECTAWLRSVLAQRRSSSSGSLGKNKRSNAWLSSNWLASTWRVGSPSKDRWLFKEGPSTISRSTRSLGDNNDHHVD